MHILDNKTSVFASFPLYVNISIIADVILPQTSTQHTRKEEDKKQP